MDNDIAIVSTDLSIDKEDIFKSLKNDPDLIETITEFSKELKENNIEIFLQRDNVIIAENGYYLAVYSKDLKIVE